MEDKTSWQKFCLFSCCVMGMGLVWTSAESISSTFDFIGAQKALLYVVALVIVGLAVLGLRRIHSVFAEEEFVKNRPWQLVSGIAIYSIALCTSLASSVHGMYFRGVQGDLVDQRATLTRVR